jgi:hypothetical protein
MLAITTSLTIINFPSGTCPIYFRFIAEHCAAMARWSACRSTQLCGNSVPTNRSNTMVQQLRLCLIAFTFLGSATVAFAQNPAPGGKHEKLNLSQQQKQAIDQGLASEPAQSSAAAQQAQVGSKVPGSVATHPMPSSVTQQVPETKNYFFVKLPDRVLVIDPDEQMIAEIIPYPATTGAGTPVSPGAR